ncbi:MAG: DUF5040 domain-containing protein [Prevotellaceae bacterium]|nr:DUF5040 domain-containing protein [Prevotellaceae bacterium]
MKKIFFFLLVCAYALLPLSAQKKSTFLLTGASFAVPQNGWFEIGCEAFGAIPVNKSVSGESIMHTATRMFNETFYTREELDAADILVIMHVHNANVANTSAIKEDYTQYIYTDINNNYSTAYDYVIKKYKDDCYKLKDDPGSKYYGTENGKPALIMLCTHWHDARTVYNASVRTLAERWNLPLVKWDDNIGFTKNVLDEDGRQPSLKYSRDTESINGITYGWHPLIGKNEYIQQKMAEIFINELETVVDKAPLGVTAVAKNPVITEGEEARIAFYFTGDAPWNLEYEINGNAFSEENITDNPFVVKTTVPAGSTLTARPVKVGNNSETDGIVEGDALFSYAHKTINPSFDTYVHQNSKTSVYTNSETLELKTSPDNYIRELFLSFNLNEFASDDDRIVLRLYVQNINYSGTVQGEAHLIAVSGNNNTYTSLNWENRPVDFAYITEIYIEANEKASYISFDISNWLKEQIQSGESQVTFRLKVTGSGRGLFQFPSMESTTGKQPLILTSGIKNGTGIEKNKHSAVSFYPNPFSKSFSVNNKTSSINKLSIVSIDGRIIYEKENPGNELTINTEKFSKGAYLLLLDNNGSLENHKIIKTNY